MTAPVLLFDLDGTLSDPHVGIVRSIRHALECLGRPCPPEDRLVSFIGPPLRHAFATLLDTPDRARVEEAMTLYRERYATVGLFENTVYSGVPEMLAEARATGSPCFVATGKPLVYTSQIVKHFGLMDRFAALYGSELDGRFDDKAELLEHLLRRERIPAHDAIMIGDRAADVVAAKKNGLRSVGVLWGFGDDAELEDAGADALCASPDDLVGCTRRLARSPGR